MTSHRGSVGYQSGEPADHGNTLMLFNPRTFCFNSGFLLSAVVVLINDTTWLLLEKLEELSNAECNRCDGNQW